MKRWFTIAGLSLLLMTSAAFAEDFFLPFMQKAAAPVVIDGVLDEWNFCFHIDVNQTTIPENSRCHDWYPDDNADLSGTVMLMWDEEYLYVAANIRDDVPGVLPQPPGWSTDGLEIYLGNYNVGNVPWDPNGNGTMPDDDEGKLACQLGFYYDADEDSGRVYQWSPVAQVIKSDMTEISGKVWESGDGYVIEARLAWADIGSNMGNIFDLKGGEIIPFTLSLYDRDDWNADDFQGYAYSEREFPAYAGPGKGWQVIEVRQERASEYYLDSSPYLKQAAGPVTVDGMLDEWNFCFPVDMNQNTIPDYSRAYNWFPESNVDLSSGIMFMYDDEYLYVGASVRDDVPGVDPVRADWNADAIEIYIGNYDIGGMGIIPDHTGYINAGDELDVQLSFYYDADTDSSFIKLWNPGDKLTLIPLTESQAVSKVWETGDGYDLEARVSLNQLAAIVDENGARTFDFINFQGAIMPCTYALYDRDEWDTDDFQGYQFVSDAAAPYNGPGAGGWEGVEILPKNLYDILSWLWVNYTDVEEKPEVVTQYNLSQNYPNPFNPTTTIEFSLNRGQNVTLKVYDVLGKEVAILENGFLTEGQHRAQFDAGSLSGGIFFYQLKAGNYSETRSMVLLK
jgi:hypothetical protein